MTTQICLTHSMMDCGIPAMVIALSVELGNMSPATWTCAPVLLRLQIKKNQVFCFLIYTVYTPPQKIVINGRLIQIYWKLLLQGKKIV